MGPSRRCLPDTSVEPPPIAAAGVPLGTPHDRDSRTVNAPCCIDGVLLGPTRKASTMRLPRTAARRCNRAGTAPPRMQQCAPRREPDSPSDPGHLADRRAEPSTAPSPAHRSPRPPIWESWAPSCTSPPTTQSSRSSSLRLVVLTFSVSTRTTPQPARSSRCCR
jgi:hypothetical protein